MTESLRPHLHLVVGARPNFMKVAPLYHALRAADRYRLTFVHTGQHYDEAMSETFLRELGLPRPDVSLGVGSGSLAAQVAGVLTGYEEACLADRPDFTVVVGDVNSTLAAAIAAAQLQIPVGHLEAGLRSHDWSMPEELNRRVADLVASVLWTPSEDAGANLRLEGVAPERIEFVGNIMIDSLLRLWDAIVASPAHEALHLDERGYAVVTLHRPGNVDDPARLPLLVEQLCDLATTVPLVFPVHPRTRSRLQETGLERRLSSGGVHLLGPLGYVEFMGLVVRARLVVTDSGGVQEETTYLRIPCVTVRPNTERPVTISQGTNRLSEPHDLAAMARAALDATLPRERPALWDGRTAERVVASLGRRLGVAPDSRSDGVFGHG